MIISQIFSLPSIICKAAAAYSSPIGDSYISDSFIYFFPASPEPFAEEGFAKRTKFRSVRRATVLPDEENSALLPPGNTKLKVGGRGHI